MSRRIRNRPPPVSVDRALFMVEVYRPAGGGVGEPGITPGAGPILGAIDIPGDELTLYLVAAPDATAAERAVRHLGVRPIRVVDVRWRAGDPAPEAGSGKPPMLPARGARTITGDADRARTVATGPRTGKENRDGARD